MWTANWLWWGRFAAGFCQSCAGGSGEKCVCTCSAAVMCSDGLGSVKFRGHDMSSDFRETTEYHEDRHYRCRQCSVLLLQARKRKAEDISTPWGDAPGVLGAKIRCELTVILCKIIIL